MKRKWIVPALAVTLFLGCNLFKDKDLPPDILGTWVTDEPRYRDCRLEFREGLVIFSQGINYISTNSITDVDRAEEKGQPLYTVDYEDREGQEYHLSFYYGGPPGGKFIRFKNQDQFEWKKQPPG
ncbi:MAG: hypothetical protein JW821_08355 [Deltaproteobacteria bacterium]|nr:hypothetical protein [Deltaproteobacteria bacterium]